MASAIKPLSSTLRVVEWDELPASVRSIPESFDPLGDGVLMLHQRQAAAIKASIIAIPKGRRTGITFGTMLNKTIVAASRKSAGGDNVFYIGDTKEKGLEAIGYCAKFSRIIAQAQGQGVSGIEEFLFEDQDADGKTRHINAYRIRFASGFQVCALSSRPANIRGLQGHVVIDEAAFHPDVQGVLDAATALLIWGGQITVISSHNTKANPFNQFCLDIEAGRYGSDAVVMKITFDDAVANGLFERVCLMKGTTPTVEDKAAWYAKIRNGYGARKSAMREELDAIPRDGGSIGIPGVWIDRAMREVRPILRLTLDDDFVRKPNQVREMFAAAWIKANLEPAMRLLMPGLQTVVGMDYARHRNFTEIVPLQVTQTLRRTVPFVVELQNVPTRQQEQILWALLRGVGAMFRGAALDATGPGQTIAEYTADEFGHGCIHQVVLSLKWYAEFMPKMIQRFEDDDYDLPRDANLESDLRAVESNNGIPQVAAVNRRDLKEPELYRHGDFAIALAMAEFAALHMSGPPEFMSGAPRDSSQSFSDFIHG